MITQSKGELSRDDNEPRILKEESGLLDEDQPAKILLRSVSGLDQRGLPGRTCIFACSRTLYVGHFTGEELQFRSVTDVSELRGRFEVQYKLVLSAIIKFRTWAGTGGGTLQAKIGDQWLSVLRFPNSMADQFHHVSQALNRIREADPPVDEEIPIEAVRRCNNCGLRLNRHAEDCPRCLHRSRIATRIYELIRPQFAGTLLLCLLTVVGVAAELVPPLLQQYMVDNIFMADSALPNKDGFVTALLLVVLCLAFSRVMLSVVSWFKGRLATRIGAGLTYTLRGQLVERLQKLAVAYYDRHQVGSLMSRVAYDSEVLQGFLHQLTGGFLLQIAQLIGVGVMLTWLNPRLAFYTLIPVPLVVLGTMFFWRHVYPRYYRLWDSSSRQNSALNDMLSGIRVVKAFAQEKKTFDRFDESSRYLRDSRLWVDQASSAYSATMSVVFSLGGLIVWYVGGRDVIGEKMKLGELIAFIALLAMFYAPLASLSSFTTWLTSFLTGSKRVLELLDSPITIGEATDAMSLENARGEIRFENVSFGYERHQPVIHDVSFTVAAGEMVGIVGRSGSGKTTMINLLGRFHEAQEGRILVDGVDIRRLTQQSLRKNIGIVLQDSFLFRGTIWDNLTFGKSDATWKNGLVAAKAAGAHDFICRAALGYETPLGERGAGLSGGEKQRLSIARTLLYDPRILILDEATSNIDAEAERSIQKSLESLIRGRTTIAIAHRLSTLRNADRIIVFDRGRLVEQGSHAELLNLGGIYARLVRLQTRISRNPDIDKLVELNEGRDDAEPDSMKGEQLSGGRQQDDDATDANDICWLEPANCRLEKSPNGSIVVHLDRNAEENQVFRTVFGVVCFPASQPSRYISLRTWNENDDETEIGIIDDLRDWETGQQQLVNEAIRARYYLPRINSIRLIELQAGYLEFAVVTDMGPAQFTLRWGQSQAQEFGERGKLLIDTEDNRFVVPDIDALSKSERQKFQQYIYW